MTYDIIPIIQTSFPWLILGTGIIFSYVGIMLLMMKVWQKINIMIDEQKDNKLTRWIIKSNERY